MVYSLGLVAATRISQWKGRKVKNAEETEGKIKRHRENGGKTTNIHVVIQCSGEMSVFSYVCITYAQDKQADDYIQQVVPGTGCD